MLHDPPAHAYTYLKYCVSYFENFTYGLRYGGVSAGLLGQIQRKPSIFRGGTLKVRGQIFPPKKVLVLLPDSKSNVEYVFAIKRD